MTTTAVKPFQPSKDLALIALIGLVKRLGFTYNASYSFGSGVFVRKEGHFRENADLFRVGYNLGRSYDGRARDNPDDYDAKLANKLCEIAQALMNEGLGVEVNLFEKGVPRSLTVFAYDNAADLEAYRAAQLAQAREDAKVTPEVKQLRLIEARGALAKSRRKAQDVLNRVAATVADRMEVVRLALGNEDAADAEREAKALEDTVTERYNSSGANFFLLTRVIADVRRAQQHLKNCEELELK